MKHVAILDDLARAAHKRLIDAQHAPASSFIAAQCDWVEAKRRADESFNKVIAARKAVSHD